MPRDLVLASHVGLLGVASTPFGASFMLALFDDLGER
jgi:hypothetical protein